jgi:uncharacterized membrane protein YoaK (UPF0700 family)
VPIQHTCHNGMPFLQSPPGPPLRKFLVKNRELLESIVLAHVLPFVAGSVNASGFFIVGAYTSHVTGSVARVGDDLAQGNFSGALQAGFLVLCFFLGAASATALLERPRGGGRSHYSLPLAAEAATLLVITIFGMTEPKSIPFLNAITTALLCLAMGLQNALVTRLSGAVVRTTHLTGIVTDMGIEAVRAHLWLKQQGDIRGPRELWRILVRSRAAPELGKLRLHTTILLAFFVGALVGPYLYLRYGYGSMLFPVLVLVLLIAFDVVVGLKARDSHTLAPPPAAHELLAAPRSETDDPCTPSQIN